MPKSPSTLVVAFAACATFATGFVPSEAKAAIVSIENCSVVPDPGHPTGKHHVIVTGNPGETVEAGTTLSVTIFSTDVDLRYVRPPATSPPVHAATYTMLLVGPLRPGQSELVGLIHVDYPVTSCRARYVTKRPAMEPQAGR